MSREEEKRRGVVMRREEQEDGAVGWDGRCEGKEWMVGVGGREDGGRGRDEERERRGSN